MRPSQIAELMARIVEVQSTSFIASTAYVESLSMIDSTAAWETQEYAAREAANAECSRDELVAALTPFAETSESRWH